MGCQRIHISNTKDDFPFIGFCRRCTGFSWGFQIHEHRTIAFSKIDVTIHDYFYESTRSMDFTIICDRLVDQVGDTSPCRNPSFSITLSRFERRFKSSIFSGLPSRSAVAFISFNSERLLSIERMDTENHTIKKIKYF